MEISYHGHGRRVVVTQDGHGHFSERPMTIAERWARQPAMAISDQIHKLACYAAFAYIKSWKIIVPTLAAVKLAAETAERERCAKAAEAAALPEGFQWGSEAMGHFEFGKKGCAEAIRASSSPVE